MPSLNLAEDTQLNGVIASLGMTQAFQYDADRSGISPQPTKVSLVEQADHLIVNQNGTSFSAATGSGRGAYGCFRGAHEHHRPSLPVPAAGQVHRGHSRRHRGREPRRFVTDHHIGRGGAAAHGPPRR